MQFKHMLYCSALVTLALTSASCQELTADEASTEQESVTVESSFNFGAVPVGAASSVHQVFVWPNDFFTDVVTAVTKTSGSCGNFSVTTPGLPADVYLYCYPECAQARPCFTPASTFLACGSWAEVPYAFQTRYLPSTPGTESCVVTVTASGVNKTITLIGTGR